MFSQAIGVDLLTIPYKGTGPAMNDLLGKQVDIMCDQTTNTTQHIKAGTVKVYAVTSKVHVATLPDLPTMQEAGFKDCEVGIWHGMWGPLGTPKAVTDKLVNALQTGLASPDFQARMAGLGATDLTAEANPEALAKKVNQPRRTSPKSHPQARIIRSSRWPATTRRATAKNLPPAQDFSCEALTITWLRV